MKQLLRKIKHSAELQAARIRVRGLYSAPAGDVDLETHIAEAAGWLKRAQDAGPDRGVSYGAAFGEDFKPSYPETTGYIIPTFLRLAEVYGDKEYETRAVEMGHWEADVQLECGAVMGGMINPDPTPAMFNTGQVLLGWADLVERLQDQRSLDAGRKAAQWMADIQQADGNWSEGNSQFAAGDVTLYNVRAAWGLGRFGRVVGEERWVEAAVRNAEYALSRQQPNGWFADCCLTDPERPLLHTIAYTMRGLLEIGLLAQRDDFVAAARRAADALLGVMGPDGFLPGRYDANWKGAARWCCLTGSAQTSIVWAKLFRLTGDAKYREAVRRANGYLMARHDVTSKSPALRGGVPGSWPVHGDYGRFLILNWATKFFIDALLEGRELEGDA